MDGYANVVLILGISGAWSRLRELTKMTVDDIEDTDSILIVKRQGGWKSSTVAKGYVEDSINNQISNKILDCQISGLSAITSTAIASTSNMDSFPTTTS
ncbi:hypothetical protein NQ317_010232 [Molorchus minor]|uniref:Uncharacterized protein n=1 Tax=Molorchus minor TaxID=1323400 RepID=A0ABQ9IQT1_9CUCU|nr:hypothetical protein NQ317_010232 [Molorchus minor]